MGKVVKFGRVDLTALVPQLEETVQDPKTASVLVFTVSQDGSIDAFWSEHCMTRVLGQLELLKTEIIHEIYD